MADDLAHLVRTGTFRQSQHRLISGADLPWPAFAALQQRYRDAESADARNAIGSEFELLVKAAHVEARGVYPDAEGLEPFTVEHFVAWALLLELDTGEPWVVEQFFADFLVDYFDGTPENWLIVPEGNTKTTSLAGLSLYLLEHRRMAWIPWAASSRDQAEIGYRQAEGFVVRSPRLRQIMKCQEGYRRIKNLVSGGRIQVFAAGDEHADGIIPTDAFIDELHRHKNLRLYRTWRGKLEKRSGQLAAISTAGEPGGEFEETRELIRQSVPVIERRPGFVHCRSEQISLHEYAVAEGDDYEDMAIVKLANPFSQVTVEALKRKRATPTMTVPHWRRFVCNLPTREISAAITEAEWENAVSHEPWPDGEPIDLGLDLGWKVDPTAMVPLWMPDIDTRLLGAAAILTPPGDGSSLDPDLVKNALYEIHLRNPIGLVVMDPTRGEQLAVWIEREIGAMVVERQQTPALLAQDFARFMEGLRNGVLKHTGDPGLTRHALNASQKILPRGDSVFERPARSRGGGLELNTRRVVDALDAAAMVHSVRVATLETEPKAPPRVIDLSSL